MAFVLIYKYCWHHQDGPQKNSCFRKMYWSSPWAASMCLWKCYWSPVSNGASAHWSGRQPSVLFAVWSLDCHSCKGSLWEVSFLLRECAGVSPPHVFDCCSLPLASFEACRGAALYSNACFYRSLHVECACAWIMSSLPSVKGYFAVIGSQLLCMWMSVVCTKIYEDVFMFFFFVPFILFAYDELFGDGQWHAPCHLSRQACLRLLCMGSHLISTCQSLTCEWFRWGSARGPSCLPPPNFYGGHSRRNCAVLVFAGQWGCTATEPVGQA